MRRAGKRPDLDQRVARVAASALAERKVVTAIDVLMGLGWLPQVRVDEWLQGRVDCLERVMAANLHKISTAMRSLAPKRTLNQGRVTLLYRFASEDVEPLPLRLKVEINSREHFSVLGLEQRPFEMRSRWFSGNASISTYPLDELLGTKLRALYQRKKARDLFDLWWAASHAPVDFDRVVSCFRRYVEADGLRISRAELEANLTSKLEDRVFTADLRPLLAPDVEWDLHRAARLVLDEIAPRLPGEPWRGG